MARAAVTAAVAAWALTAAAGSEPSAHSAGVVRLQPPELNRTRPATSPTPAPLPASPLPPGANGGDTLPEYPERPLETPYRRFISYPNDEKSETCDDLLYTGVKFRTGEPARCPDLVDYCHVGATNIAKKVRYACQRTCGMCALETTEWTGACEDSAKDAVPILTAGGNPLECQEASSFCSGSAHSELVAKKCPVTCGKCTPTTPKPEVHVRPELDPHRAWITTPEPPPPADADSDENNGVRIDTHDAPIQCSRRRRYGFCYTRRRRDYV